MGELSRTTALIIGIIDILTIIIVIIIIIVMISIIVITIIIITPVRPVHVPETIWWSPQVGIDVEPGPVPDAPSQSKHVAALSGTSPNSEDPSIGIIYRM